MKLVWLAALPLVASCLPPPEPVEFTLLQADVSAIGACDESAVRYGASLCVTDVERTLRDAILDLAPDVVALQGVLPDDFCAGTEEADDRFVCAGGDVAAEPSQARRLLGTGYVTTCGAENPTSCLGVRLAGNVLAEEASYDVQQRSNDLPPDCDPAYSVGRGSVHIQHNGPTGFDIMIGALEPGPARIECRVAELNRMFALTELFVGQGVVLTGSFNVDPAEADDADAAIWTSQVGDGASFRDLSGTLATTDGGAAADHVASDLAEGTCATLGESPGTVRLDGGSGTDHRAIFCELGMPPPKSSFE